MLKVNRCLLKNAGLNHFLEENEIEVIDTDLGERIVQLSKEPPSHIVMPAIHKKREEIDTLFHKELNTNLSGGDANLFNKRSKKTFTAKIS